MKAPALLASFGALAAIAALWLRLQPSTPGYSPIGSRPDAVASESLPPADRSIRAPAARVEAATSRLTSDQAAPVEPAPNVQAPARDSEAELESKLAQKAYARVGQVIVDELVVHGLARSDGERIARKFFAGSVRCFVTALREEAAARSLAYDPLLEALEAEVYDTDAALLPALIDMAAVQTRAAPCGLSAAEQAGIPPSIMATAARAAAR